MPKKKKIEAPINYPDGWPIEDLQAWCKKQKVPEPKWLAAAILRSSGRDDVKPVYLQIEFVKEMINVTNMYHLYINGDMGNKSTK